MKNIFSKILLGIIFTCCLFPSAAFSRQWGEIMVVTADTSVMAARSNKAKIKARVKAGNTFKADFFKGGWYAVFSCDEKVRSKKKMLGYIAAKRLKPAGSALKPAAYSVKDAAAGPPRTAVTTPAAPASLQTAVMPLPPKIHAGRDSASSEQLPQVYAGTAGEAGAAATSSVSSSGDGIILRDIRWEAVSSGHERVFIYFNRQALPVLSSIQNESPRVVADFEKVVSVRQGLKNIPVGGRFIKRIRSSYDSKTRILRIVLDLDPSKNYLVNQVFSQKENIYVFDVSED